MPRSCSRARRLLSADLDGEATPSQSSLAQRHLSGCADCTSWLESVQKATRRVLVTSAVSTPDVTDAVLERRRRTPSRRSTRGLWVRTALVSLGLVQLEWSLSGLAHDRTHLSREMVAFDLAVALGVLAVALRPWRAAGLLPVLAALTAFLTFTSTLDLVDGRTSLLTELPHALVLLELLAVWRLRVVTGPVGVLPPGPTGKAMGAPVRRSLRALRLRRAA